MPFRSHILFLLMLIVTSCGAVLVDDVVDVSGIHPEASYSVYPGAELKIKCTHESLPLSGDLFRFVSVDRSTRRTVGICQIFPDAFTVKFPEDLKSGEYILYLVRDGRGYRISISVFKVGPVPVQTPEEEATVWGYVTCDGEGVSGVVVSDGYEVTITDYSGLYLMKSSKTEGHVFISIPQGYKVPSDKAMAQFYRHLKASPDSKERADFEIERVGDRKESLIVMGDMHLAGINNDVALFEEAVRDMIDYAESRSDRDFRILTLGDMTWDSYWYSTPYGLNDYILLMARLMPDGLQVFNTIGNHDHDQNAVGDVTTSIPFRRLLGPSRYSFDFGGVHVMVIDNVECTNSVASTTDDSYRSYRSKVVPEVLQWITRDLQYVDSDVPVIVAAHCPVYKMASTTAFSESMENAEEFIRCFRGRKVYFLTAHNHTLHNVDNLKDNVSHFEHNAAAVCAAWWQTDKLSGNSICADGTPGGYSGFDLDDGNVSWKYKPVGEGTHVQCRAYDLNCVNLSADRYIPNCTIPEYKELWHSYVAETNYAHKEAFTGVEPQNKVLINIWNWDPEWKLSVVEGGRQLDVTRIRSYDPLFLASYVAPRLDRDKSSNINPKGTSHMFVVQASSESSDIEIKITDRFGNIYTQNFERPKLFSINEYDY